MMVVIYVIAAPTENSDGRSTGALGLYILRIVVFMIPLAVYCLIYALGFMSPD